MKDKKIYSNKSFVTVCIIAGFAFAAAAMLDFGQNIVNKTGTLLDFSAMLELVMCCEIYFLYKAYTAHEKNVVQILIGSMLGMRIAWDLYYTVEMMTVFHATGTIIQAILLIVDGMLMVNHIAINSEKHSTPDLVHKSKVLLIVAIIGTVGTKIPYLIFAFKDYYVPDITSSLAFIMMYVSIILIENNIDEYKQAREEKKLQGEWDNNTKNEVKKDYFGE